jgi:predicted dehydrogenase
MKIIKAVCVGAGNRGNIYANYALTNSDKMNLIAVVDPNPIHRNELADKHSIPANMRFSSIEDFVSSGTECDLVINATMDSLHYETAKALLYAGYDVLLEKPVTNNAEELLDLKRIATEKQKNLFVCHLMRYTPFYKGIKQHILNGDIGTVTSIKLSEYVGVSHFIESFVVGKWRNESECGSSLLLAKSCHDIDMLCWLNNSSAPKKVASFASRGIFVPRNAPEGATSTCHTCPHEKSCKYSLTTMFTGMSGAWKRIMLECGKPATEVTQEDIYNKVKTSHYGRCVFEGNELVDRQNVIVEFENGSIGTFDLIGSVAKADRYIHIVGELGEIFGNRSDGYYTVRTYDFATKEYVEQVYDISAQIKGGHSGGDIGIMTDICNYLNGDRTSVSMTSIDDSVNGHLCVYAAEKSRKNESIERIPNA